MSRSQALLLVFGVVLTGAWPSGSARADINLEWRPAHPMVNVGDVVGLGLYAVSDNAASQPFSAVQAILTWTPAHLELLGLDASGGVGLFSSGFPPDDAFNLNEASPPADGDALWVGLALPAALPATPEGSLLTTFLFEAHAPAATQVAIAADGGDPVGHTKIIGTTPNQDVLGSIGPPALVQIVPEPTAAALLCAAALSLVRRRD